MNACFVGPFAVDFVVTKFPLVFATIDINHNAFALFFAIYKVSVVCHAIQNLFSANAVGSRLFPLSFVAKNFLFEILPVLV